MLKGIKFHCKRVTQLQSDVLSIVKVGHYRPTNETPFEWRSVVSRPMVARDYIAGLYGFRRVATYILVTVYGG